MKHIALAITSMALVLAACGSKAPRPTDLQGRPPLVSNGPDEFSVLQPKALSIPSDLSILPEPTPGGQSLTDASPLADAIRALGGTPKDIQGE